MERLATRQQRREMRDVTDTKFFDKFTDFVDKNTLGKNIFWLLLVFFMVVMPRFNRNDLLIKRPLADAEYYITYTHYFRGDALIKPFYNLPEIHSWKPVVPYLAAWLPFDAHTNINIIDILFLLLGLVALHQLFIHFNIKKNIIWLGLYLFTVSFPMFYYATIGYLDAAAVGLVCVGLWCLLKQKWGALFFVIVVGNWAKESVLVLVPATFLYVYAFKKSVWQWAIPCVYLVCYAGSSWLIRQIAPKIIGGVVYFRYNSLPETTEFNGFWQIKPQIIIENLSSSHFYGSYALTFLPLLGMILYVNTLRIGIFDANKHVLRICLAGIATSLAMHTFSLLAGVPDGRLLWVSYPFGIFYVVYLLQNQINYKQNYNKQNALKPCADH